MDELHTIEPLKDHPHYRDLEDGQRAKRECRYIHNGIRCKNLCSYYCVKCTTDTSIFPVCGSNTERKCCFKHQLAFSISNT